MTGLNSANVKVKTPQRETAGVIRCRESVGYDDGSRPLCLAVGPGPLG